MRGGYKAVRSRKRWPDTKPLYADPTAKACSEAGGVLLRLKLDTRPIPPADNGGCGDLTHVAGTNGGRVRCGSVITWMDGTSHPYFCDRCSTKDKGLTCTR
jgi:hypothetical protein